MITKKEKLEIWLEIFNEYLADEDRGSKWVRNWLWCELAKLEEPKEEYTCNDCWMSEEPKEDWQLKETERIHNELEEDTELEKVIKEIWNLYPKSYKQEQVEKALRLINNKLNKN